MTAFSLIVWYRERTLRKRNIILEETVQKRTLEISRQKDQINEQKVTIEEKNKDITDSIRAAKYIQDAVLPPTQILNTFFNDSFIIYWPRDIVSGDFYWIKERKKDILITAADCTGHGVPGAFMSLLGISFLNNMVSESGNDSPAEILNKLRNEVIKSLNQSEKETKVRSGMDAALIAINKDRSTIEYAGAYNPLVLIRDKGLEELKADKMPIAYYEHMEPFTNHSMQLQEGDQLYFFSDGFADQFGGPDNKKIKRGKFYKWLLEIEGLPFNKQSEILEKNFNEWKGESDRVDDVVLIGIKV
jgi:serine phosphatase RsbU (regulator of sigma subunit)